MTDQQGSASDLTMTSTDQKKMSTSLVPSRQDIVIIAMVMALVIIAWMVDSVRKIDHINNDMHVVATMVAKDLHPDLYLRDTNYATDELYRFYTPAYRWLLGWLWQTTGDFEWGLVWLTPFVLGTYLIGMYLLLMRVTGNTWIALGLTVASAGYYETMGGEIWGSGGSTLMLARTIFSAVVPLLMFLVLDVWQKPTWGKMILLGLGLGVVANLHPPSGMHLTVAVMGMLVLLHGCRSGWLRVWTMLAVMALTVLAGVGFTLSNYVQGTSETELVGVDFPTLRRIVTEWYYMPFSPPEVKFRTLELILGRPQLEVLFWIGLVAGLLALGLHLFAVLRWPGIIRWFWLIGGLVVVWFGFLVALFNLVLIFALVACYIIYRFYRGPISQMDSDLVGWAGLIVVQSFIAYYVLSIFWINYGSASLTDPVAEQIRAARFIYLPIFLLTGLACVALVSELGRYWQVNRRGLTRISVSVAIMAALLPGLSQVISNDNILLGFLGLLIVLSIVAFLAWRTATHDSQWLARWGAAIGIIGIVIVWFGPPATIAAPYLHIPAVNMLDPAARAPDLRYQAHDQALYTWVKAETEQDALFFWCDFGPTTTLHFRLKVERSLTHHWRDLNQRTYNPGTLAVHHTRYRQFEQACSDLFTAVAAAAETGADFILVPSRLTADFKAESCFFNERYAVFPVRPTSCPNS